MAKQTKSTLTEEQQELIYQEACKLQENHDSYADQRRAMKLFQSIFFYKDSDRHVSQTTYRAWEIRWNKRMKALKKWVPLIIAAIVIIAVGTAIALHMRAANAQQRANEEAYAAAQAHIDSGEYTLAYEEFQKLGDFEDSADRAAEARSLLEQSQIDALATAQVGDKVTFGFLKNDLAADADRFGLTWRVLAAEDGKLLLLSNGIITNMAYSTAGNLDWESSDVRAWLNGEFFDTAFTPEQKELVCATELDNGEAGATEDLCFALSADETKRYFDQSSTTYDLVVDEDAKMNADRSSGSNWWLRSNTADGKGVLLGWMDGALFVDGYLPTSQCGVRPAMWVSLS